MRRRARLDDFQYLSEDSPLRVQVRFHLWRTLLRNTSAYFHYLLPMDGFLFQATSARCAHSLRVPGLPSCFSVLNSQTARFLPCSSSASTRHTKAFVPSSQNMAERQLRVQDVRGPTLFSRLLCLLDPSSFDGNPLEAPLGMARVFVLVQAGSRLGGQGTLYPYLIGEALV